MQKYYESETHKYAMRNLTNTQRKKYLEIRKYTKLSPMKIINIILFPENHPILARRHRIYQ